MSRKKIPEDYDATKRKIIQAAMNLMVKGSISNFRISDVANELGITRAAIYWYFPSKEALIDGVAEFLYKSYTEYASGVANSDLSPTEKLRTLFLKGNDTYDSNMMGMFPVKLYLEFCSCGHTLKELVKKGYAEFYKSIEQILQEGIQKGEFKTDFSVFELTIFISGAIDGLAFQNILLSDDTVTVPKSFLLRILERILL